jgi:hypothetical protein
MALGNVHHDKYVNHVCTEKLWQFNGGYDQHAKVRPIWSPCPHFVHTWKQNCPKTKNSRDMWRQDSWVGGRRHRFHLCTPPPSSNRLANEFAVRKISLLRSVEALRRPTRSAVSYDSNLEPVARLLIIIYSYTLGLVVGYIESFFQRT